MAHFPILDLGVLGVVVGVCGVLLPEMDCTAGHLQLGLSVTHLEARKSR